MKRRIEIAVLGLLLAVGWLVTGCSSEGPLTQSAADAKLQLSLQTAGRTMVGDQLGVRISGNGMEAYSWVGEVENSLRLERLIPGADRIVEGWIDNANGVQVYRGEKTVDLLAGSNSLAMQLLPQYATLLASFPIGVNNPAGIAGGVLQLTRTNDTLTTELEMGSYKARFYLERLFYGDDWNLLVAIWGNNNDTIYRLEQPLVILPNSPKEIFMDLSTLQAELVLTIELGDPETLDISLELPDQKTRAPHPDELLFTELMVNPKTSGDPWEWMELTSLSRDTLNLDNCVIARERSSAGTTNKLNLPNGIRVPPMERIVLGRDSVAFADYNYKSFAMLNNSQSLVLFCGTTLVDSILYYGPTDAVNPFPVKQGATMELDMEWWENRLMGSSWKLATDSLDMGGWWGYGTPGW